MIFFYFCYIELLKTNDKILRFIFGFFSTLRDGVSCTSDVACVILAGVMTWLEGSFVVGNLTEVG